MLTILSYFSMITNCLKYLELKSSMGKTYQDLSDYSRIEEELGGVHSLFITSTGKVHDKYQQSFNQLGIKTRSWALLLKDQRLCHIIAPSESGLQLYSIQNTENFLTVKSWSLEKPSRSVSLEDFSKLITQTLTINEKIIEITKIVCSYFITPSYQDLLKSIGVVKSERACNCPTCGSESETNVILIE